MKKKEDKKFVLYSVVIPTITSTVTTVIFRLLTDWILLKRG